MWLVYALASAVLTGSIAVTVKYGQKNIPRENSLIFRCGTTLVLCAALIVAGYEKRDGAGGDLPSCVLFALFSGVLTLSSLMLYYKTLQGSSVALAAALEKLSVPLTFLAGALIFGADAGSLTPLSALIICIGVFVCACDGKKERIRAGEHPVVTGVLSAVFACGALMCTKYSLTGIGSVSALALRSAVCLMLSLILASKRGVLVKVREMSVKSIALALGTGLASALAYLCSFYALSVCDAGRVHSVEKLSALFAIAFARLFFGERAHKTVIIGNAVIALGIIFPLFF